MLKILNFVILNKKEALKINEKYNILIEKYNELKEENNKLKKLLFLTGIKDNNEIIDDKVKYIEELKELQERNIKLIEENLKLKNKIKELRKINNIIYKIVNEQDKLIQECINNKKNIKNVQFKNNFYNNTINNENNSSTNKVIKENNSDINNEMITLAELKKTIDNNYIKEILNKDKFDSYA